MKTSKAALPLLAAAVLGLIGAGYRLSVHAGEQIIAIKARKFDYTPDIIHLKKGVPVVLELTSADVLMGFNVPDLHLRADIVPGQVTRVQVQPDKAGTFPFFCDVFCGSGHEDMTGAIIVDE